MIKFVRGIALPYADQHFEHHLTAGPEFEGAGTYQFGKIEMALTMAPDRRGVAVDVGGHVGLWSRVLTRYFDKVVAFEPVPALAECFMLNAPLAELRQFALGEQEGECHVTVIAENSGNCHVVPRGDISLGSLKVRMTTLDGILPVMITRPIDLLKLDVEGFEVPVLNGGRVTIQRDRPAIVVECKPGNAERYGLGQTQAVKLLMSWGYAVAAQKSGDYFMKWQG